MSKIKRYKIIGLISSLFLITGCPTGEHTIGNQTSQKNMYISDMILCQEDEYYFVTRGELNSNNINVFNFSKEKEKIKKVMNFDINNSNDIVFSHLFCAKDFNKLYLTTKSPKRRVEIDLKVKKVKIEQQQKENFTINQFETFSCNSFSYGSDYDENFKSYCSYEDRLTNEKIDYVPLPSKDKILQSIEEISPDKLFGYSFHIYPYVQNKKWDKKSLILFIKSENRDSDEGYIVLLVYKNNEWKNVAYHKENNYFTLLHTTSSMPIYLSNVQYYNFTKDYVGTFMSMPMMQNPYLTSVENNKIKMLPLKNGLSENMDYQKITNSIFHKIQGRNSQNYNITPTLDKDGSLFFIFIVDAGLKIEFYDSKSETPNEPTIYRIEEKIW